MAKRNRHVVNTKQDPLHQDLTHTEPGISLPIWKLYISNLLVVKVYYVPNDCIVYLVNLYGVTNRIDNITFVEYQIVVYFDVEYCV